MTQLSSKSSEIGSLSEAIDDFPQADYTGLIRTLEPGYLPVSRPTSRWRADSGMVSAIAIYRQLSKNWVEILCIKAGTRLTFASFVSSGMATRDTSIKISFVIVISKPFVC